MNRRRDRLTMLRRLGLAALVLATALGLRLLNADSHSPASETLPEAAFLPPDLFGIVHLKFGQLWRSVPAQEARAAAAPSAVRVVAGLTSSKFGISADQLERFTLCFSRPDGSESAVLAATADPYDPPTVARRLGFGEPADQERLYGGMKLRTQRGKGEGAPRQGLAFLTRRLYAFGSQDLVMQFIDQARRTPSPGPMEACLHMMREPHLLVVGARPGQLQAAGAEAAEPLAVRAAPPMVLRQEDAIAARQPPFAKLFSPQLLFEKLNDFGDLKRFVAAIDLEPELRIEGSWEYGGESAARRGFRLAHAALGEAETWAGQAEAWLKEPGRVNGTPLPQLPEAAALASQAREGLEAAALEREGSRVFLKCRGNLSAAKLYAVALEASTRIPSSLSEEQRRNNLNGLALALHNFHRDYERFPEPAIVGKDGKPLLSWRVRLLPYLEQKPLYDRFKLDEPWDSPHNKPLLAAMPDIFSTPCATVAEPPGCTYLQLLVGSKDLPLKQQPVFCLGREMTQQKLRDADGASNTLIMAEAAVAVPWTKPEDLEYRPDQPLPRFGGAFPGDDTFLGATADGTVRCIRRSMPDAARHERLLRQLITFSDGNEEDDGHLFKY